MATMRRKIATAVVSIAILVIAAVAFTHTPSFQAALQAKMKDRVPSGWFHIWVCLWTGCNPLKIVDPTDPRFKAERFRFEDYGSETQLAYVISRVVMPGMDRKTVDDILVASGHASLRETQEGKAVYYSYPDKTEKIDRGVWVITVYYPDHIHVERVWVHGIEVTSNGKEN